MKRKIPAHITKFCKENPRFVSIKPNPDASLNNCFKVVENYITINGGKQIFGWCIHVWKKVLIEAEFHCMWENPEKKLD